MATEIPVINDIETYRKVADAAYAKEPAPSLKFRKGMKEAGVPEPEDRVIPAPAGPPAGDIQKFTKPFTPEERTNQRKALIEKLKGMK